MYRWGTLEEKRLCECFDFRGVEGYPTPENPKFGLHRYKQSFGAGFTAYIGQLDLIFKPKTAKLLQLYATLNIRKSV